jgi:hypothetical protein
MPCHGGLTVSQEPNLMVNLTFLGTGKMFAKAVIIYELEEWGAPFSVCFF